MTMAAIGSMAAMAVAAIGEGAAATAATAGTVAATAGTAAEAAGATMAGTALGGEAAAGLGGAAASEGLGATGEFALGPTMPDMAPPSMMTRLMGLLPDKMPSIPGLHDLGQGAMDANQIMALLGNVTGGRTPPPQAPQIRAPSGIHAFQLPQQNQNPIVPISRGGGPSMQQLSALLSMLRR